MEELFKAIYLYWKSDACAAARELVPGDMWLDTAEERTVKPYATYVIGMETTEHSTDTIVSTVPVTFTFCVDDSEPRVSVQIADAFVLAFDKFDQSDAARTMAAPDGFSATVTQCNRRGRTGPLRLSEKLYTCECDYDFVVSKTRN